jgi:replication factor A1
MKITELRDGLRRVDVEAKVLEISEPREVRSRYTGETFKVAEATINDESGTIKLVLWNEQIGEVKAGDTVKVENGYIRSFRGEMQLNVGRYGKLTVL